MPALVRLRQIKSGVGRGNAVPGTFKGKGQRGNRELALEEGRARGSEGVGRTGKGSGNKLGVTGAAKRSTWAAGQQSLESQVSPPVDSGWKPNPWACSLGSRNAGGCERRWRGLRREDR